MNWFIKESKRYMSYSDRNLLDKIKFWLQFPIVYIKYCYYGFVDLKCSKKETYKYKSK